MLRVLLIVARVSTPEWSVFELILQIVQFRPIHSILHSPKNFLFSCHIFTLFMPSFRNTYRLWLFLAKILDKIRMILAEWPKTSKYTAEKWMISIPSHVIFAYFWTFSAKIINIFIQFSARNVSKEMLRNCFLILSSE